VSRQIILSTIVQGEELGWLTQGAQRYDVLGKGRDDGHESGEYSPIFYLKTKFHCLERFVCHSFLVSLSNWTIDVRAAVVSFGYRRLPSSLVQSRGILRVPSLSFGLDLPLTLAGLQVVEFAPGAVSRLPR